MPELKGSRTEANLAAAFAGESQASIKYAYYAAQARKEGHIEVSDIFSETAANEHAHGKIWFKLLHDGQVPGTEVNLMDAAQSEHYERSEMYVGFAREAEEEGFTHIAALFRMVAQIAKEVRPDFIKTSTGFAPGGATLGDVKLMKAVVGDAVKIKAAGGIRDLDTCLAMIDAGAERIGTSSGIAIVEEYKNRLAEEA